VALEISDELKEKYIKTFAGKPYRPANGTEGMTFQEDNCFKCKHWVNDKKTDTMGCKKWIYDRTLFHDLGDPEYPKEWKYNDEAIPICTAFIHHLTPPKKRKPKQKPAPLFEKSPAGTPAHPKGLKSE